MLAAAVALILTCFRESPHHTDCGGNTLSLVCALLWGGSRVIMTGSYQSWQTFYRILWIILFSTYILGIVDGQCFVNRHLATRPSRNLEYRTDMMSLKDILISVLDFTIIMKQELPGNHGNVSITYPGDTLCPMLGEGFGLDFLTTQGLALVNSVPLLTNIIKISNNRFVVPNQNVPAHLNASQLQTLLSHLDIQLSLSKDSPPQLFMRKDDDGKLHLESFSPLEPSSCKLGPVVKNIFHGLQNTLQVLQKIYDEVDTIIKFFGSGHLYSSLSSCLQVTNITLSVVMKTDNDKLEYCTARLSNATSPRIVRRSTMLGWLFGSGQQLDEIEQNLMDSIEHYNQNFEKISAFDEEVVQSFNRLEKDISSLVEIEAKLQDRVGDLQVQSRLMEIQSKYLLNRLQHEITLNRLLSESKMLDNIKLLSRSLFGANECHLALCENSISPEIMSNDIVKIHREIINLVPTTMAVISCLATKNVAVPSLHNQLGDITTQSKVLVNNRLYSSLELLNATVVNERLHPLPEKDISLNMFHHFSNNSQLYLQCLREGEYFINKEPAHCSLMKYFKLEEDHVIESNGHTLRSHMLVQKSHHIKTQWMNSFTFSNVDKLEIPPPEQFTILHPTLESIFLTPAGEVHVAHTSYFFSIIFIITLLIVSFCCYKSPSCRNGFVSSIMTLKEKVYIKLTTKEYREKKELEDLNDKVNTNWQQISNMEALIQKKTALLAARQVASHPTTALSSSGSSSAPPIDAPDMVQTQADIHVAPIRSSSTTTLKQQAIQKK